MATRGEEELDENLTCPICTGLFDKATLLFCGHTFCKQCLLDYDRQKGSRGDMECPICRKVTKLSENRVEGLVANVTVNGLVDDFKSRNSAMHESPTVVKEIDLTAGVRGMTALSDDTIVVGYGRSVYGAESITASGVKKQYLKPVIGPVRDLVILKDKRPVVSHGFEDIKVYNNGTGRATDIPFERSCNQNTKHAFCTLHRDQNDTVYAVNGTGTIHIIQIGAANATRRAVTTGHDDLRQICATKEGILIAKTHETGFQKLIFFTRDGIEGSSISASGDDESIVATVDNLDRVIVGYFKPRQGRLTLSFCKLSGPALIKQQFFKTVFIPKSNYAWWCMVSLTPTLLAVAHLGQKLCFVKIPSYNSD